MDSAKYNILDKYKNETEDVQKEYQKINEEVRNNDELKDMITKEQALFQMINDVQQAMTKPIGDLYDDLKAK